MRKALSLLLLLAAILPLSVSLVSCSDTRWTRTEYGYFDTVVTVTGYGMSESDFRSDTDEVFRILRHYHILTDIYTEATGTLYELNKMAGEKPVKLPDELLDFLSEMLVLTEKTEGSINMMMGSVLSLWREARDTGVLPSDDALREAARHTSPSLLSIDRKNGTAELVDPHASIDVGAIAKGYAAEKAADYLRKNGKDGYLFDLGGNVVAVGDKNGTPFTVGIRDPKSAGILAKASLSSAALVTSGSYLRYFTVGDTEYHHIVSPDTLYPADTVLSVTVHAADSGLADLLSTALFVLGKEAGTALLSEFDGASALFIEKDGSVTATAGFPLA